MIKALFLPTLLAPIVAWLVAVGVWLPAKHLAPSYVMIRVENDTQKGVGSGVYLGGGTILTVAHVVHDAKTLTVETLDGQSTGAAVLWQSDKFDVAMIELNAPLDIAPANLACREAQVGERVEGVGNPFGISFVHTWGRIGRRPSEDKNKITQLVDITVGPGMGGGPLFDSRGNVAGIFDAMLGMPIGPLMSAPLAFTVMIPSSAICHITGRG